MAQSRLVHHGKEDCVIIHYITMIRYQTFIREFHLVEIYSSQITTFGGLWESTVKSVKRRLYKIVADKCFTYEGTEGYSLIALPEPSMLELR